MVPQHKKKLNVLSKVSQYLVACGLKVVLCLNGDAAVVGMFGAKPKDKNTPIASDFRYIF